MKSEPSVTESLLREFAQRVSGFVSSSTPRALLKLDGCENLLTNEAHCKQFKVPFAMARTSDDAINLLEKRLKDPDDSLLVAQKACHCEATSTIIAIKREHCAFERASPENDEPVEAETKDVALFMSRQNGVRHYDLYSVKRTILAERFLDVELAKLVGLSTTVKTVETNAKRPTKLSAVITLNDAKFIEANDKCLADQEDYNQVFDLFEDCIVELRKGLDFPDEQRQQHVLNCKDMLWGKLQQKGMRYAAIRGFVNGTFGNGVLAPNTPKPLKQLIDDFERIQERLFDATIAVGDLLLKQGFRSVVTSWQTVQCNKR